MATHSTGNMPPVRFYCARHRQPTLRAIETACPARPTDQIPSPGGPTRDHAVEVAPETAQQQAVISLVYALGLLLIFILSLLLLPADTGLGKLLWSSLSAGN